MLENIKLNNGVMIPVLGLGTYSLSGDILVNSLKAGLDATSGNLLVDAAHSYQNEQSVGDALLTIYNEGKYSRENVFLTSKIGDELENGFPIGTYFYDTKACLNHDTKTVVKNQLENSLKDLKTDYLDLLLIHWPYNDVLEEIWDVMIDLRKKGLVRALGVSNCRPRHIERLLHSSSIRPQVNQIYISPYNIQDETRAYCSSNEIVVEAYSPLHGIRNPKFAQSKDVLLICQKYNKGLAQVVLRWNYQHGVIPIPRSSQPSRVLSNMNIFDFNLSSEEMALIDSFNDNYQLLPESRYCPGY